MIDGKRGQAVQALKAGDRCLGKGTIEVERQLLYLRALAEELDQPLRD